VWIQACNNMKNCWLFLNTSPNDFCTKNRVMNSNTSRKNDNKTEWSEEAMVSSAACECGVEDLTVDHVALQCPTPRHPHGLHSLTVLDDETIEWLLNTCPGPRDPVLPSSGLKELPQTTKQREDKLAMRTLRFCVVVLANTTKTWFLDWLPCSQKISKCWRAQITEFL